MRKKLARVPNTRRLLLNISFSKLFRKAVVGDKFADRKNTIFFKSLKIWPNSWHVMTFKKKK